MLSCPDPSVRNKPPPTDAAGSLLEHPHMLGPNAHNVDPVPRGLRTELQLKIEVGNFLRAEGG
jgi:hypothetical protein